MKLSGVPGAGVESSVIVSVVVTVSVPVALIQMVLLATYAAVIAPTVASAPPMFIVTPVPVPGDRSSVIEIELARETTSYQPVVIPVPDR